MSLAWRGTGRSERMEGDRETGDDKTGLGHQRGGEAWLDLTLKDR